MTEKRFQVFVSSTFRDLIEERQEVTHALLELDCIPSGMELFPAANDDQWTLIKKVIDDCDYYIVILAGKYGSIGPEGLSYTEMEYRYALEKGKPIIAFLYKDLGKIAADRIETDSNLKNKVEKFRDFAQKKMVKFWENPTELGSVVSRSIVRLIKSHPAIGWVRGNEIHDESSAQEILRLRNIIDGLKPDAQQENKSLLIKREDLSQGEDKFELDCSVEYIKPPGTSVQTATWGAEVSWNFIFAAISPTIADEARDNAVKIKLNDALYGHEFEDFKKDKLLKSAEIESFTIEDSFYDNCMLQFMALGLIEKFGKPVRVGSTEKRWRLTPSGETLMFNLKAIRRNK